MSEKKTQNPILKWAQRKDKLFITISVVHSKKPIVDLTDGKRIKYQGTDGNINYKIIKLILTNIFNILI